MARKRNFIQSLVILGAIAGIGFTLFENREALAQTIKSRKTTQDDLTPKSPEIDTATQSTDTVLPPSELNKTPSLASPQVTVSLKQQAFAPQQIFDSAPTPIITTPKITQRSRPRVLRPQFLAPRDVLNPKEFNKRKFGIDPDLTRQALKKPKSRRTIQERKQLEANRARQVFDSSSITNF